jgi:hypothetical protein
VSYHEFSSKGGSQIPPPVNRRFDVRPAAVAFPSSTTQVSSTVVIGKNQGLRVVARSGGVRGDLFDSFSSHDEHDSSIATSPMV